jgi:hypothetical protein
MKNVVFWDVTPCGFCNNRLFGGNSGEKVLLHTVPKLLLIMNVVPSSLILFILMMEALSSSAVLTTATRHHIPEDDTSQKTILDLFPSRGDGRKTPILLGPLERTKHNHSFLVSAIPDDGQSTELQQF